ncbi:MAG: 50S ribosomal protein L24 [Proteobacteria bacterium]|nr:50S ribosomal protein L24 [Pseudomonadota bacterium]
MSTYLKKDDVVITLVGKDKGKTGKILKVLRDKNKVVVEKINIVKRHVKPTQINPQGGIIEKEMPIDVSNVLLYCKKCQKGVRIGKKLLEDGSKARVCKKCGEIL